MQTTRVTYKDECKPQGLHRLRFKTHPAVYKPLYSSNALPKRVMGHRPAPPYDSRHTGPLTPCYSTETNSRPSWYGLTAASRCSHGTRPSAGLSSPCCLPEVLWATKFDKDRYLYGQDVYSQVMTLCLFPAGVWRDTSIDGGNATPVGQKTPLFRTRVLSRK